LTAINYKYTGRTGNKKVLFLVSLATSTNLAEKKRKMINRLIAFDQ